MNDLAGWVEVSCWARESVIRDAQGLVVGSSLTDPERVIFTEWWFRRDDGVEFPILRDYLWPGGSRACRHYLANSPDSWRNDD